MRRLRGCRAQRISSSRPVKRSEKSFPPALPSCGGSALRTISRPLIDVTITPIIPTSGGQSTTYSRDIGDVEANALLVNEVARQIKHFRASAALRYSHQEFMDITDALHPCKQEELFYTLAPKLFGDAVLVSHAIVRQWDAGSTDDPVAGRARPATPAAPRYAAHNRRHGSAGAARRSAPRQRACNKSGPGIDMLCVGNNLLDRSRRCRALPLERCLLDGTLDRASVQRSIDGAKAKGVALSRRPRHKKDPERDNARNQPRCLRLVRAGFSLGLKTMKMLKRLFRSLAAPRHAPTTRLSAIHHRFRRIHPAAL